MSTYDYASDLVYIEHICTGIGNTAHSYTCEILEGDSSQRLSPEAILAVYSVAAVLPSHRFYGLTKKGVEKQRQFRHDLAYHFQNLSAVQTEAPRCCKFTMPDLMRRLASDDAREAGTPVYFICFGTYADRSSGIYLYRPYELSADSCLHGMAGSGWEAFDCTAEE